MLLWCLRHKVDWLLATNTSSLSPVKNKRRRLPAISVNNLPQFVATECIALGSQTVHSTPRIVYRTYIQCLRWGGGPRRNIAVTFGMENLEWFGYLMVKKF